MQLPLSPTRSGNMNSDQPLPPATIDAIARRILELGAIPSRPLLTVRDVAGLLQVSEAWVYENARRLGAVRLGEGSRAPLRFSEQSVLAVLEPVRRVD